jgi:hypothetical protein
MTKKDSNAVERLSQLKTKQKQLSPAISHG